MPDEIVGVIGWIIRMIAYQILGKLIEKLFYWPGWLLLRLVTFGQYPQSGALKHDRFAVALFAVTVIAFASVLIY
jgi:hypothetical protein